MKYDFKIGSRCLLVHRKYCRSNIVGGRIILAKVKTWENKKGVPEPVFTMIGQSKHELTLANYLPFIDEQKAIDAIKINKK